MVDMTPWRIGKDEIMTIATRKGYFSVPRYIYRAEPLFRTCRKLVKDGRLKISRELSSRDECVYVPIAARAEGGE